MEPLPIRATMRTIETIAELDAYVAERNQNWPMDSVTRSEVALRRIELQMGSKK